LEGAKWNSTDFNLMKLSARISFTVDTKANVINHDIMTDDEKNSSYNAFFVCHLAVALKSCYKLLSLEKFRFPGQG
jgi:hypothetical protein